MKKIMYAQMALLLILFAITAKTGITLLNGIAMATLVISLIANMCEIGRDSDE